MLGCWGTESRLMLPGGVLYHECELTSQVDAHHNHMELNFMCMPMLTVAKLSTIGLETSPLWQKSEAVHDGSALAATKRNRVHTVP